MKRRRPTVPSDSLPPHLAEFNGEDWPEPSADSPWEEFGVESYQRLQWHRARRQWQRENASALARSITGNMDH